MASFDLISLILPAFALFISTFALPTSIILGGSRNVSQSLFNSLEELARLVDISYCVGSTGIQKPFSCLNRCNDFQGFELVTVGAEAVLCGQTTNIGHLDLEYRATPFRFMRLHRDFTPSVP